jgi:hypothetical protein
LDSALTLIIAAFGLTSTTRWHLTMLCHQSPFTKPAVLKHLIPAL